MSHVWLSLSGQAPLYLADYSCLVSDSTRRSLRSADVPICVAPRTLGNYADRISAAAGPRLLNSLPVQLRIPGITYTDCSDDSSRDTIYEKHEHREICVAPNMRHLRKTLTYLLTMDYHLACQRWPILLTISVRSLPVPVYYYYYYWSQAVVKTMQGQFT